MSDTDYEGKVVAITGAASGIGRATAKHMAARGARLALADINGEGLQAFAADLPGPVVMRVADVGDAGACQDFIGAAVAAYRKLDMLCNVAGILDWSPLGSFDEARWDRIVSINLGSVFFLSQAAAPHLIATKGNIVNVASAAGLTGVAYASAYCATKHGVVGMTKALAVELAGSGVRVNVVCPTGVNTPMVQQPFPEGADMALLMRAAPKLGGLVEPEEVAEAIAYLGSGAARSISGIALPVDGAQTAG